MRHVDCGRLVDGTGRVLEDARVAIDDGRIEAVGAREDVPAEGERIDHADATVTPGLIDAHVHLQGVRSMDPLEWTLDADAYCAARATADLRALLEAGFTAVRDLGSTVGIGLRDAVADGEVPGPRIYTSGPAISQTGGHGDHHSLPYEWVTSGAGISTLADGVTECRREARKRARANADCLKIMTTGGVLSAEDAPDQRQFVDEEIAAMVEEAHRVGMPVASHAQGVAGIEAALRNGVDTIEHAFYLDESTIELLLEHDATVVPTMAIMDRIVSRGEEAGVPQHGLRKAEVAYEAHTESIRRAYEAGVPIAAGTDFIGPDLVPHGENARELELYVERIGMSGQEAIEAATGVAARTLPDDDLGTIEPGNRADLVAFDGDPLDDIEVVREPAAVYRGGERVDRT